LINEALDQLPTCFSNLLLSFEVLNIAVM